MKRGTKKSSNNHEKNITNYIIQIRTKKFKEKKKEKFRKIILHELINLIKMILTRYIITEILNNLTYTHNIYQRIGVFLIFLSYIKQIMILKNNIKPLCMIIKFVLKLVKFFLFLKK